MNTIQIQLTHQERDYLLNMLQTAVEDKHAEVRRTDSHNLHDQLRQEETLLRRLMERLREPAV